MISDGLHPGMHRAEYDRIERLNFSALKNIRKSAAHYHHYLTTPPEDTDPKKLGRVVHVAAFEPERFQRAVAVWDGGVRRGKDWDAFCKTNVGRELLTMNEYGRCTAIQKAVRADAAAMGYVSNGRGEVALIWTTVLDDNGFEAKGRIDFDAQAAIVDLKTTKDASPEAFPRQVVALGYDAQAAWYADGYERATGIRKPYVIVAVESCEPYVVQTYRVPDHVLALGRLKYESWLRVLAYCRETNQWPGYARGELELELPAWALPAGEVDSLGLEIDS